MVMILQQLKRTIQTTGGVTCHELAKQFHLSEAGVDAMLAILIKKGQIKRSQLVGCNGCTQCPQGFTKTIIYRWQNAITFISYI